GNPTTGPPLTASHWAPSLPPLLCRRHRLSTCAGIGRIPPRLAAIGTSANSAIGSHDLPEARCRWAVGRNRDARRFLSRDERETPPLVPSAKGGIYPGAKFPAPSIKFPARAKK